MIRRSRLAALAVLALSAGACGASGDDGSREVSTVETPLPTIAGVGALPDTVPTGRQQRVLVPAPINSDGSPAEPIGSVALGNRVLVIGDSIMASTAERYGGQMCEELVPLGWQVAVEAEPSRFIDFGNRVLDRVLPDDPAPAEDWHAAVVFLGSNYGGDAFAYDAELRRILDRLAPRPTVLFTVTEYRANYAEVNVVVRRLAQEYANVSLLDWQAIAEEPGVLSGDRLHPTNLGREVLAQAVAAALGPVSIGDGDCLRPAFRDDSGIGRGDGGGSSIGTSTGSSTVTPTTRPATTTTTVGSGSVTTSTAPSGSGGGPTPPSTTVPSTTAPPTTVPPTTVPATTAPPTTTPPPADDLTGSADG
ncbi:MAG TPA: hypothetical protein VK853_11175 [Ilumatobacteraceae bacterium]|nr:hypothetical protein [Ilumatobacteraceae bacterium]